MGCIKMKKSIKISKIPSDMGDDQVIRESKSFILTKSVHRYQVGKCAKFQNNKITSYKIILKKSLLPVMEITKLIKPDYFRDTINQTSWKFYDYEKAEKAWAFLLLKYE